MNSMLCGYCKSCSIFFCFGIGCELHVKGSHLCGVCYAFRKRLLSWQRFPNNNKITALNPSLSMNFTVIHRTTALKVLMVEQCRPNPYSPSLQLHFFKVSLDIGDYRCWNLTDIFIIKRTICHF